MQRMHESHGSKVLRPSLRANEAGMALTYVTLALPVIIAFALLAVDVGRFTALNSSPQHGANVLAFAGAAELDRPLVAFARSEDAMKQFATQNTVFLTSSATAVGWPDVETCYLETITADDATAISSSICRDKTDLTTTSKMARFVQVAVKPRTYTTVFPVSFLGSLSETSSLQTEAVAGFQSVMCIFTPLDMCNPFESTSGLTISHDDYGLTAATVAPAQRMSAIEHIQAASSGTATTVSGQFGYLSPVPGHDKTEPPKALTASYQERMIGVC